MRKENSVEKLIFGLGIRHVGSKAAKIIFDSHSPVRIRYVPFCFCDAKTADGHFEFFAGHDKESCRQFSGRVIPDGHWLLRSGDISESDIQLI